MDIHISSILGKNPTIKIMVIGAQNTGKSSLIHRFVNNKFSQSNDGSMHTKVSVDGISFTLDIIDGQYSHCNGDVHLLLYDLTSKQSFDWMRNELRNQQQIPMVVAATKCDLEEHRQIAEMDGISLCKMINIPFFEVSAKNSSNIQQCFHQCFREYLMVKTNEWRIKHDDPIAIQHKNTKKQSKLSMDLNIAVIGTHNVGKSALIHSFINL